MQLMNQRMGEGIVVPLEVVPFIDGIDPTKPPVSRGVEWQISANILSE